MNVHLLIDRYQYIIQCAAQSFDAELGGGLGLHHLGNHRSVGAALPVREAEMPSDVFSCADHHGGIVVTA